MRAVVAVSSLVVVLAGVATGCRDLSRFSTGGDRFEGTVVAGAFVRSGVAVGTKMCLTLDTDHLQDAPGAISSDDGRFASTPLRPIPQLWQDPLSTFSFGEGREKNLLYVASPTDADGGDAGDLYVVVSLMTSGGVEVRLLRGAPPAPVASVDAGDAADAGPPPDSATPNVFAVFTLGREPGPCDF
jgi:hypothetical protein